MFLKVINSVNAFEADTENREYYVLPKGRVIIGRPLMLGFLREQ